MTNKKVSGHLVSRNSPEVSSSYSDGKKKYKTLQNPGIRLHFTHRNFSRDPRLFNST